MVDAKPDVISHNVETVRELTKKARDPRAKYYQSLSVLQNVKKLDPDIYTKSAIMAGIGETDDQVYKTMDDLRSINVDFLTIGQYLQPTKNLMRVESFIPPEIFESYRQAGLQKGFLYVAAGPFVRSSFMAGGFFEQVLGSRIQVIQ